MKEEKEKWKRKKERGKRKSNWERKQKRKK